MKDTEIEIQVKIEKTAQLLRFLKKNGTFIHKTHQIDEYYTPKHRNFTKVRPVKEWLRIRKSGKGTSVTYKNWKHGKDGKCYHCDEYQTGIDDYKQIKNIFQVLNIKLLGKVDKQRQVWKYKSFEVSFDKVRGLGSFIEIEYKGKIKKKIKEIVSDMIFFLKSQNCGKIHRNQIGYIFMILFPKEIEFEKIEN